MISNVSLKNPILSSREAPQFKKAKLAMSRTKELMDTFKSWDDTGKDLNPAPGKVVMSNEEIRPREIVGGELEFDTSSGEAKSFGGGFSKRLHKPGEDYDGPSTSRFSADYQNNGDHDIYVYHDHVSVMRLQHEKVSDTITVLEDRQIF